MADFWRERFPDEVTCVRCLQRRDRSDVDRLLWCKACRHRARQRAARRGWIVGVAAAMVLAIWIWLVERPSDLIIWGWVATVVAGLWIGSKVAREIAYGVERYRNRRAVEAVPPAESDPTGNASSRSPSDG